METTQTLPPSCSFTPRQVLQQSWETVESWAQSGVQTLDQACDNVYNFLTYHEVDSRIASLAAKILQGLPFALLTLSLPRPLNFCCQILGHVVWARTSELKCEPSRRNFFRQTAKTVSCGMMLDCAGRALSLGVHCATHPGAILFNLPFAALNAGVAILQYQRACSMEISIDI